MKLRTTIVFLYFFCLSNSAFTQVIPRDKAIIAKRVIELNHYSPRPVDDSFSTFVFKTIINTLDSRRLFFTAAEYRQLAVYTAKLDDELQGRGWDFLNQLSTLYKKVLVRSDSMINTVLKKPFNLSAGESITVSSERGFNFAANEAELNNRWSRYLKLRAFEQLYALTYRDSVETTITPAEAVKYESIVRNKIRLSETRFINRVRAYKGGPDGYLSELYLNTMASAFDPHTNYLSSDNKEAFQSEVSSEGFSFGLELDENQKGEFIIQHLQPGGPAWKSGELHKGDELIALQPEGQEPFVLAGETLEAVYEMLFRPGQEKISFKIRKNNGLEKTITLRKEKINNEENVVRSFILTGGRKIGYVLLPGFYTEWENESGSSCAGDVAKEIIKLKRENIDGLILDVRYNGGGSMGEALEMAGIFIDEGPLTGEKERSGKVIYLRDPNRGLIYAGPMVLLVNGQSASASEMLAASLQDYNRAVIVGGNTYGKATMQELFLLDTITGKSAAQNHAADALKITVGKLYRLNGQSAQLTGVKPDVLLPDEFDVLRATEKYNPNALLPDTVKKNSYYKPLVPLPLEELSRKSTQRLQSNSEFKNRQRILALHASEGAAHTEKIPLDWDGFQKWLHGREKMLTGLDVNSVVPAFQVGNHQQATAALAANSDAREWNDILVKNISGDIYLHEAFFVLCDLINLQKTR